VVDPTPVTTGAVRPRPTTTLRAAMIGWVCAASLLAARASAAGGLVTAGAPGEAQVPVLPLPRMPGSVRLASRTEHDDATGEWKITAAFRVPAHVPQVLAFYRKALADAGLAVDEIAAADGEGTPILWGKNERVQARIDLTTKPGELETRIWILWHVVRG
jgi:hypothetical protein